MQDQYGRTIDYIRISVTDRCNLRCVYCMPEEGIQPVDHDEILTFDEILRLCRIFVSLGIHKVKLTGGEPLVRRGLTQLIRGIRDIPGITSVTMTTNGILLKEQLPQLYAAGIQGINVSLDTRKEQQFADITRRSGLSHALEGIEEGLRYPNIRMKINCVPLAGINDDQWVDLAGMAEEKPLDVRFIEMMPIGLGRAYPGEKQEMIFAALQKAYGAAEMADGSFGNGPSTYVQFPGFVGKVGFISAISHKFCSGCNRVRLTSEGELKPCLQYAGGLQVRDLLRGNASDEILKKSIEETIYKKPKSHHFNEKEEPGFEQKEMSRIGG
ncbi:MAG: GTP 3',8-cyclase MoaA [Lachnospiraceae bacterium]|nr:GTP 3',8-cyclase MoaA [Lachnospiraceae bacterium]